MEDKIKQFISLHKDRFDDEQLPTGHLERFDKKLRKQNKPGAKTAVFITLAAAACVALMLIHNLPPAFMGSHTGYTCETRQEVEELQFYYHMQMNNALARMEEMYDRSRTPGTAELLRETKKVQIENLKFEEEVLPNLPCMEETISIINQRYGNSFNSIQIMLEHMKQITEMNITD